MLDRRVHTTLGPDSQAGEGPVAIVQDVRHHVRPLLIEEFPDLRVSTTKKRAIVFTFNEPLEDGADPPVELVVALTRAGTQPGLWIPNLKADSWDAADPETHRRLINSVPSLALRKRRARVVRFAKWWNKAFSSFNLQAEALKHVTGEHVNHSYARTLQELFEAAADDLRERLTDDPADVSGKLKLQNGISRTTAVRRLDDAADAMATARAGANDQDAVREALTTLFGETVVNIAHDAWVIAAQLAELDEHRKAYLQAVWQHEHPVLRLAPGVRGPHPRA